MMKTTTMMGMVFLMTTNWITDGDGIPDYLDDDDDGDGIPDHLDNDDDGDGIPDDQEDLMGMEFLIT